MSLLDIPYFGQTNPINYCVRFLLKRFQNMFFWLEKHYLVDIELMHCIKGLPLEGDYLAIVF